MGLDIKAKEEKVTTSGGGADRPAEKDKEPEKKAENPITGDTSDPSAALHTSANLASPDIRIPSRRGGDNIQQPGLVPLTIEGAEKPPEKPPEPARKLDDKTIQQYAVELHEAINRRGYFSGDPDSARIEQLTKSLGQADLKALEHAYAKVPNNTGFRSLREEAQKRLDGDDWRKLEATLNKTDGRTNDAGNLMVALSAINDDRGDAERRVIETFATLNKDTMKLLDEDFKKHYGMTVEEALKKYDVSSEALKAVEFMRKPIDQRTSEDVQNFARYAVEQKNIDYLSIALRGETPAAQQARKALQQDQEFTKKMADAFKSENDHGGGFMGFVKGAGDFLLGPIDEIASGLYNGDLTWGKALGGTPIGELMQAIDAKEDNIKLLQATDLLREGRISLATIALNNTGSLWGMFDNNDNIKLAVNNASEVERKTFTIGRDVAASGRQPANDEEKVALDFYNRTKKAFEGLGDKREEAALEATLTDGKEGLRTKIASGEKINDRFAAVENMSEADWKRLKDPTTAPAARADLDKFLGTFMDQNERTRMMQLIDGKLAKNEFAESQSVRRTLTEVVEDNKGSKWLGLATDYDGKAITTSIASMSPTEAQRYKTDAAYRQSIDQAVKDNLEGDEKPYAERLLTQVAQSGEPPKIGPAEKILENRMNGVEPKIALNDIEQLLQKEPELRKRLSGDPASMSPQDRALRETIDQAMNKMIFSSPAYRSQINSFNMDETGQSQMREMEAAYNNVSAKVYKELWESGCLPVDVKADLNLKTRAFYEQAGSAPPEERARLLQNPNVTTEEKQLIESIAANGGKMDLAHQVRAFTLGDGSNYADFKETFSKLTPDQRQQLKENYTKLTGSAMEDDFLSKVDKKDQATFRNLLTPAEVDGRQDFYDNLEEGLRSKSGYAPDGTELTLDRAMGDQAAMLQEFSQRFEKLSPADQEKANQYFREAIEAYRTSKEQFAEKLYQAAVLVGGLTVAIATGGVAIPALLAVAAVAAAGRVAVMRGIRGEDYEMSLGNLLKDGAIGAATGAFSVLGPETLIALKGAGAVTASGFMAAGGAASRTLLKEGAEQLVAKEAQNLMGQALLSGQGISREAIEQLAMKIAKDPAKAAELVPALQAGFRQGGVELTESVAKTTVGSFTREIGSWATFGGATNVLLESSVGVANGRFDVANLPSAFLMGAIPGGGLAVAFKGIGLAKPIGAMFRSTPDGGLNVRTNPGEEIELLVRGADGQEQLIKVSPDGVDLPNGVKDISVPGQNIDDVELRPVGEDGKPLDVDPLVVKDKPDAEVPGGNTDQVVSAGTGDDVPVVRDNAPRVDDQGRRINEQGKLVDDQNRLIDDNGRLVNEQGQLIDEKGNIVRVEDPAVVPDRPVVPDERPRDSQGRLIDDRGRLINDRNQLVNSRGERVNEDGWRINEEGQILDSKGNVLEYEFPAMERGDHRLGREAVRAELENWQTVTGKNVFDEWEATAQALGMSTSERNVIMNGLAEIREHAARMKNIDPEQKVNWDHTMREFGAALEYAKARGMGKEETQDLLLAAMWSDGLKTKFNFTTHNMDGALAFQEFARRHRWPDERTAGIMQAIKEHQIAPPEFMATIYGGMIKNSKPPLTEAELGALNTLTAKMANPFAHPLIDVPGGPSGAKALELTDVERSLLQRTGLDQWHVPHEGNSWNRISRTLIDADGTDNYLGAGGASKIVKLRGPEKAPWFADRHARFTNPENPKEISSVESWMQSRRDFVGNPGKLGAASDDARAFIAGNDAAVAGQIDEAGKRVDAWINSPEGRAELGLPAEGEVGKIPGWTGTKDQPDLLDYSTATPEELARARKVWDRFGDELSLAQRTEMRPVDSLNPVMEEVPRIAVPNELKQFKTDEHIHFEATMGRYAVRDSAVVTAGQTNVPAEFADVHAKRIGVDWPNAKAGDYLVRDGHDNYYIVPKDEFEKLYASNPRRSTEVPEQFHSRYTVEYPYPTPQNPMLAYKYIGKNGEQFPEVEAVVALNGDYVVHTGDGASYRIPADEFQSLYKRVESLAESRTNPIKVDTPPLQPNDKVVPHRELPAGTEATAVRRADGTVELLPTNSAGLRDGDTVIGAGSYTKNAEGGYELRGALKQMKFDANHRLTDVIDLKTSTHTQVTYGVDATSQTTVIDGVYRYNINPADGSTSLDVNGSFMRNEDGMVYMGEGNHKAPLSKDIVVNQDGSVTLSGKPGNYWSEHGYSRVSNDDNTNLLTATYMPDGTQVRTYGDNVVITSNKDRLPLTVKTAEGAEFHYKHDPKNGTVSEVTLGNGKSYTKAADGTFYEVGTTPPKPFATKISVSRDGVLTIYPHEDFRIPGRPDKVITDIREFPGGTVEYRYRDGTPVGDIQAATVPARPTAEQTLELRVQRGDLVKQADGTYLHSDTVSGAKVTLDAAGRPVAVKQADGLNATITRANDGSVAQIEYHRDGKVESILVRDGDGWKQIGGGEEVNFKHVKVNSDGSITKLDDNFMGVRERPDGVILVVDSLGQERIPPAALDTQRARVMDLQQKVLPSPEHQARFKKFMDEFEARAASKEPPVSQEEIANTYLQIERVLAADGSTFTRAERALLAQQMMLKAADPTGINQGQFNTCNVTAEIEHRFFSIYPSQATRVIADVVENGRFITADGSIIDMTHVRNGLAPYKQAGNPQRNSFDGTNNTDLTIDKQRDLLDQVFQTTVINTYWQRQSVVPNTTPSRTARRASTLAEERAGLPYQPGDLRYELGVRDGNGEFLSDFSTNPPTRHNGFKHTRAYDPISGREQTFVEQAPSDNPEFGFAQMNDANSQILGYIEAPHAIGTQSSGIANPVKTVDEMLDQMRQMQKDGVLPATAYVDARHPIFSADGTSGGFDRGHGRHVVNVKGFYEKDGKWYVEFTNQWGRDRNRIGDNAVLADDFFDALNHRPIARDEAFPPLPVPRFIQLQATDSTWQRYAKIAGWGVVGLGAAAGAAYTGAYGAAIIDHWKNRRNQNNSDWFPPPPGFGR